MSVLIAGDKIAQIGKSITAPPGATVIYPPGPMLSQTAGHEARR